MPIDDYWFKLLVRSLPIFIPLSLSLIQTNIEAWTLCYTICSEENLQLLFTVVENAPSEVVRSNCTIALGDLAVRFPNLLEPWTENMYARLRDSSVSVRKNAVLVLSHLILNDMMKVWSLLDMIAHSIVNINLCSKCTHCFLRWKVTYMRWLCD